MSTTVFETAKLSNKRARQDEDSAIEMKRVKKADSELAEHIMNVKKQLMAFGATETFATRVSMRYVAPEVLELVRGAENPKNEKLWLPGPSEGENAWWYQLQLEMSEVDEEVCIPVFGDEQADYKEEDDILCLDPDREVDHPEQMGTYIFKPATLKPNEDQTNATEARRPGAAYYDFEIGEWVGLRPIEELIEDMSDDDE